MIKRALLYFWIILSITACHPEYYNKIITVNGVISPQQMGFTLPHEHVLVDFIGADSAEPPRYIREAAMKVILPQIRRLLPYGVKTFVECTPRFLGRDPLLLKQLADSTGIRFLTNTGYYGAQKNKFIPDSIQAMEPEKIALFWIDEFKNGIGDTGIKPGFIKIAVERSSLSEFHARLARAAAITHKATGLTIMSHSGPAPGAFQQMEILKEEGVSPEAFIWTHAHNEKDSMKHVLAAQMGAWVAFDAFWGTKGQLSQFVHIVVNMKNNHCLQRLLLSQDSGWFDPDKPDGSNYHPHTMIFEQLIPALREAGITGKELHQIFVENPARAFAVRKRLVSNNKK
jgi:predicted metal-dependent phosphotriesterase family hydrolase